MFSPEETKAPAASWTPLKKAWVGWGGGVGKKTIEVVLGWGVRANNSEFQNPENQILVIVISTGSAYLDFCWGGGGGGGGGGGEGGGCHLNSNNPTLKTIEVVLGWVREQHNRIPKSNNTKFL